MSFCQKWLPSTILKPWNVLLTKTVFFIFTILDYFSWARTGKSVPGLGTVRRSGRLVGSAVGHAHATRRRRPAGRSPPCTGMCRHQGSSTSHPCSTRACRRLVRYRLRCFRTPLRSVIVTKKFLKSMSSGAGFRKNGQNRSRPKSGRLQNPGLLRIWVGAIRTLPVISYHACFISAVASSCSEI